MVTKEQIHKFDSNSFYIVTVEGVKEKELGELAHRCRIWFEEMENPPKVIFVSADIKLEKLTDEQKQSLIRCLQE